MNPVSPQRLSDSKVVYAIFFESFEELLEATVRFVTEEIGEEDVTRISAARVDRLVGIFCGNDSAFCADPAWHGAPLGRHLREIFHDSLQSLSPEQRELFASDSSPIVFAACQFVSEACSLTYEVLSHDVEQAEQDGKLAHDLCVRWTERFTGRKFDTNGFSE